MLILGNESKENPKQDLVENHFAIKIKQSEIKNELDKNKQNRYKTMEPKLKMEIHLLLNCRMKSGIENKEK